jgi:hypothetical protein
MALRFGKSAAVMAVLAATAFSTGASAPAGAVPVLTVATGIGGYYVTGLPVSNAEVRITPLAGLGKAAEQVCDERDDWGLQVGLVAKGKTFAVEYAAGKLGGCVGDNMLAAGARVLTPALTGIPAGDEVFVYAGWSVYRQASGTKATGKGKVYGEAVFAAMDQAGCGCQVWSLTVRGLPADRGMTSDGIAVQQDTAGPKAEPVAAFAYADTDIPAPEGFFGLGPLFGTEGSLTEVITEGIPVMVTPDSSIAITTANGDTSFGVLAVPVPVKSGDRPAAARRRG